MNSPTGQFDIQAHEPQSTGGKDTRLSDQDRKWLCASRQEYAFLRNMAFWAIDQGNLDVGLELFTAAASFATLYHPGFFSDDAIENAILKIGLERELDSGAPLVRVTKTLRGSSRSILHVFSEVNIVGGHTATLVNWICADRQSQHKIVLVRQTDSSAVDWLRNVVEPYGVEVISLDVSQTLWRRATQLRQIASEGFDACVVQASQSDVVPILAFAAPELPPIAYVDHADHSFWLGTSVADLVIHQRPIGDEVCAKRRNAKRCHVLPIPLKCQTPTRTREQARSKLGFSPETVMALTVGREMKFRPTKTLNFFHSILKLTERHQNLIVHVVGVTKEQAEKWAPECNSAPICFHGEVPVDPDLRLAADVYLESYPFGSQTAMLEAAIAEIASVRAPKSGTRLLATSDRAIDSIVEAPADEAEFVEFASRLIRDRELRDSVALSLRHSVAIEHTSEGWKDQLAELYRILEPIQHSPSPIRKLPDRMDEVDVALHRWHRNQEAGSVDDHRLRLTAKALINRLLSTQLKRKDVRLLSRIAARSLAHGHGDRTIVGMGIQAAITAVGNRVLNLLPRNSISEQTKITKVTPADLRD